MHKKDVHYQCLLPWFVAITQPIACYHCLLPLFDAITNVYCHCLMLLPKPGWLWVAGCLFWFGGFVDCLIGWLTGRLVGWVWLVGWLVDGLVGWLFGSSLVGCRVGGLAGGLVWLVGCWLVGWLAGWLVGGWLFILRAR